MVTVCTSTNLSGHPQCGDLSTCSWLPRHAAALRGHAGGLLGGALLAYLLGPRLVLGATERGGVALQVRAMGHGWCRRPRLCCLLGCRVVRGEAGHSNGAPHAPDPRRHRVTNLAVRAVQDTISKRKK